jgi:hypothetical protein
MRMRREYTSCDVKTTSNMMHEGRGLFRKTISGIIILACFVISELVIITLTVKNMKRRITS